MRLRTCKLLAIDRFAAGAVAFREVASLKHKLWDDAVERGPLVTVSIFTSSQFAKVPGSLGHISIVQFEDDATSRLVVDVDIKLKKINKSIGENSKRSRCI